MNNLSAGANDSQLLYDASPSRFDPLNDYLFYKVMGEKGNEAQLLGFINAVLGKTGDDKFISIEILENKTFTPENIGDKSVTFDVRAVLHGKTSQPGQAKVNVEVQLRNEQNMNKRSLFYWSKEFSSSLKKGQNYSELPDVIAINIVNFDYLDTRGFHNCFQLRDAKEYDKILTEALEIHFINMVKYRRQKRKDKVGVVSPDDPLYRWLVWFDKSSPRELIEEVVMLDIAIQAAENRYYFITNDDEAMDLYNMRFKAMCDHTSSMDYARSEGLSQGHTEGRAEERQRILELLNQGLSAEELKQRL